MSVWEILSGFEVQEGSESFNVELVDSSHKHKNKKFFIPQDGFKSYEKIAYEMSLFERCPLPVTRLFATSFFKDEKDVLPFIAQIQFFVKDSFPLPSPQLIEESFVSSSKVKSSAWIREDAFLESDAQPRNVLDVSVSPYLHSPDPYMVVANKRRRGDGFLLTLVWPWVLVKSSSLEALWEDFQGSLFPPFSGAYVGQQFHGCFDSEGTLIEPIEIFPFDVTKRPVYLWRASTLLLPVNGASFLQSLSSSSSSSSSSPLPQAVPHHHTPSSVDSFMPVEEEVVAGERRSTSPGHVSMFDPNYVIPQDVFGAVRNGHSRSLKDLTFDVNTLVLLNKDILLHLNHKFFEESPMPDLVAKVSEFLQHLKRVSETSHSIDHLQLYALPLMVTDSLYFVSQFLAILSTEDTHLFVMKKWRKDRLGRDRVFFAHFDDLRKFKLDVGELKVTIRLEGTKESKTFDALEQWRLSSQKLVLVDKVMRMPGTEQLGEYNLFRGNFIGQDWTVPWQEYSHTSHGHTITVSKVLHHIYSFLCARDQDVFNYIMRWLAHVVQRPLTKTNVVPFFYSEQGIGKGIIFDEVMSYILGERFQKVVRVDDVAGQFNSIINGKTYVVMDEVWMVPGQQLSTLKDLITGKTMVVQGKGKDQVARENHLNFVMLSNRLDRQTMAMEHHNRRFLFIECDSSIRGHFDYFEALREFFGLANPLESQVRGVRAFADYLYKMDIQEFEPANFPSTGMARQMMFSTLDQNPVLRWWYECLNTRSVLGWAGDNENDKPPFVFYWQDRKNDHANSWFRQSDFDPLQPLYGGRGKLYGAFARWCQQNDLTPTSQSEFGIILTRAIGTDIKEYKMYPTKNPVKLDKKTVVGRHVNVYDLKSLAHLRSVFFEQFHVTFEDGPIDRFLVRVAREANWGAPPQSIPSASSSSSSTDLPQDQDQGEDMVDDDDDEAPVSVQDDEVPITQQDEEEEEIQDAAVVVQDDKDDELGSLIPPDNTPLIRPPSPIYSALFPPSPNAESTNNTDDDEGFFRFFPMPN